MRNRDLISGILWGCILGIVGLWILVEINSPECPPCPEDVVATDLAGWAGSMPPNRPAP